MFRIVSVALVGASLVAGSAAAQIIALPTTPPPSSGDNVQHGAIVGVGSTPSGNPAVGVDGGQQAPVQATAGPERTNPSDGLAVYARTTKQENGVPVGIDARVMMTNKDGSKPVYQGVELGRQ